MKKLYLSILILFLTSIISFFSFLFFVSKEQNSNHNISVKKNIATNNNIQKTKPNKKISDNLPSKIYHINGEIKKITKDSIFIEAIILEEKTLNSKEKAKTQIIEVKVNNKTKITKLTFAPKKNSKNYSSVVENISLNDLKINDRIEAIAGSNIKGLKSFLANSIQVMPKSIQ